MTIMAYLPSMQRAWLSSADILQVASRPPHHAHGYHGRPGYGRPGYGPPVYPRPYHGRPYYGGPRRTVSANGCRVRIVRYGPYGREVRIINRCAPVPYRRW